MSNIKDSGYRHIFKDKNGNEGAIREITEDKPNFLLFPIELLILFDKENMFYKDMQQFFNTRDPQVIQDIINNISNALGWDKARLAKEVSTQYTDGARKYPAFNWQKGLPWSSYLKSAFRHFNSLQNYAIKTNQWQDFLKGYNGSTVKQEYQPDPDDEHHERAVIWNLVSLLWTMENRPEFDDLDEELNFKVKQ